ncbi:MAG: tRNA uridine-5-carboxymethylaminomethyl(34) synthesis GTPase MnmE, partial [Rhodocyclaceae bacterium]|nr:tRNA uridine-5-carboxymethylaminomethyl(34) synthesis GTPase MnmE [Rhodocyclaceae bacterium]
MPKNPPTTAASAKETIAAIATASGRGGIGVVRISGAALAPLAEQLTGKPCPAPRMAALTAFLDEHGQAIDHGILLYFPAPHSFTGEDVLELHGHGGPVVLQLLLARCLALGARLARPGEFTERAFLNGKLDLAQAESVASLIDAATEAAARAAVRSLSGEFSARIRALADELLQLRLELEAALDFPEEEIDFISEARVQKRLAALCARLDATRTQARRGAVLEHGLTLVLAGRPNVGKSSLLNALAEEERAIVTDLPGTTRDALHHRIAVHGIAVTLIDTAGLRTTDDPVERLGIERAWQEIARADLVLRLLDASAGETEEDRQIAAQLPAHLPTLTVWNKTDLTTTPAG